MTELKNRKNVLNKTTSREKLNNLDDESLKSEKMQKQKQQTSDSIIKNFNMMSKISKSYESFHKVRDSLLSSSSGYTNYRGFLNLCVVLLVMSTGRLVIENILKYGFLVRIDIPILFIQDPTAWPSLLVIVCLNFFIMLEFYLEKKLEREEISGFAGNILCYSNVLGALVLPAAYLWYREANPISSFFALATCCVVSMKLISYFQVNKFYRLKRKVTRINSEQLLTAPISTKTDQTNTNTSPKSKNNKNSFKQQKKSDKNNNNTTEQNVDAESKNNISKTLDETNETNGSLNNINSDVSESSSNNTSAYSEEYLIESKCEPLVDYPENLTIKDIYYFIAVPTLCYEINFPRSDRIRKRFLIRRLCEMAFLLVLQYILIQQWIVPILQNSKMPFRETNILRILERLLKLAVPNHVVWLIGFYCFFHSYLNALAEILKFGDREFYRDWWNAEDVSVFWQNWNIPVHHFCLRHIYKPLLTQGISKFQASLIVFFISAFFHEYLVSIPLRMFRLWSFLGMIMQIPFAAFVKKFLHGHYGNMAVWISLIIGQPIAIIMYIHDYYIDFFKHV